ncbi:MAG: Hpt domain-containing protein [Lachnospiraceae bacterium]|nr:Hpt domain-containing protein [Lachnospiraceae bacterium]
MTIEKLNELGADTKTGLARCAGMEAFYLSLVEKSLRDTKYDELEGLIHEHKYKEAFEVAHALKGVLANLSLTPVLKPISEITEGLRNQTEMDYSALLVQMKEARNGFLEQA